MALGARVKKEQDTLFYVYPGEGNLLKSKGGSFYAAFDELLEENGFDAFVEDLCRSSYASVGRPGLPPGVYFRMMMVGYFEGFDSERKIAWQCHDRLSLRTFLYGSARQLPPDHSTVSRTRRRLSREIHVQVFAWVLGVLYDAGLLEGKTLGVDSTTLQANASMRALRRREDGTHYEKFLEQLAKASGIETPTREELIKLDRRRPKKASNREWESPADPEARIAKMKDGRTRFAHKFEQATDMESGAVVAVTVQSTEGGDCASNRRHAGRSVAPSGRRGAAARRGGLRQGVSLERDDEELEGPGASELRERAEPGPQELDEGSGREGADACESAQDTRRARSASPSHAGREARAELRASAEHRGDAESALEGKGKHREEAADSRVGLQSEPDLPKSVRRRHAEGPGGAPCREKYVQTRRWRRVFGFFRPHFARFWSRGPRNAIQASNSRLFLAEFAKSSESLTTRASAKDSSTTPLPPQPVSPARHSNSLKTPSWASP